MVSLIHINQDIIYCQGDAIVNSVGIHSHVYGGICAAIIKGAKSKELVDILDSKMGRLKAGDLFETQSYELPCNRIIHVVTPYRKDDSDLSRYRAIIKSILEYCVNNHIESVTLGPIGTGANGYERNEALKVISEVTARFSEDTPKSVNLTVKINSFSKHDSPTPMTGQAREMFWAQEKMIGEFYAAQLSGKPIVTTNSRPSIPMSFHEPLSFRGYVDRYMELREKQDGTPVKEQRIRLHSFVGTGYDPVAGAKVLSNYIMSYDKMPKKHIVFLAAMALKMDYPEAKQLFEYAGYGLSPIMKVDRFYLEMLIKQNYDWEYIVNAYQNEIGYSIYPKDNSPKKFAKAANH